MNPFLEPYDSDRATDAADRWYDDQRDAAPPIDTSPEAYEARGYPAYAAHLRKLRAENAALAMEGR